MTVYRTTKCPYCGFKLECFSMNAREQVGHPSNVCPRCKGIFKTGMEYWFEMSKSDKFSYLSGSYLLIIWTAFGIYTIAPFLLFCAFTGDFIFETPFLPLILTALAVWALYLMYLGHCNLWKLIKKYSDPMIKDELNEALMKKKPLDLKDGFNDDGVTKF